MYQIIWHENLKQKITVDANMKKNEVSTLYGMNISI